MDDIPYGYCHCGCGEKTNISTHTSAQDGRRKGEPCRFLTGHAHRLRRRPLVERFWSHVVRGAPDDCWLWEGTSTPDRYAKLQDETGRHIPAHVIAAQLAYGPVPTGLQVNHHCDVKRCCNPRHLYYGTQKENIQDAVERGLMKFHVENLHGSPRGETAYGANLSNADVIEIVRLRKLGISGIEIAQRFNIHKNTAWLIGRGEIRPEGLAQYLALNPPVSSSEG